MPDRLAELRRQRDLIQEHLTWLDQRIVDAESRLAALEREIAEAEGKAPASATATPPSPAPNNLTPAPGTAATGVVAAALKASAASASTTPAAAEAPEVAAAAEAILEDYRSDPVSLKADVRKGCFLYFFAALALVALGVTVLWFALRHD